MDFAVFFIEKFAQLLEIAIIIRVLMSWFQIDMDTIIGRFVGALTDPMYGLVRKIFKPAPLIGPLDLTPIVAYFMIFIGETFLLLIVNNIPL